MSWLVQKMDRLFYPGVTRDWDDQLMRQRVLRVLEPDHAILDLGAGSGRVKAMNFRGRARRVCGIDPDPRVAENPNLDEGHIGKGEEIPYPAAEFDLVIADNVLEHLEHPVLVFREVSRVLKPGGHFIVKTPNKTHYMPLIARITPHSFHQFINRLRGRDAGDTFPTRYRANTGPVLRRLADEAGLDVVSIEYLEGRPEYMRLFAAMYLFGWLYERLVNSTFRLAGFRVVLIAQFRRR